jgi:hypothetical protein
MVRGVNAKCDAYAHAGYIRCKGCGAIGLPTEASWLDAIHILVTFSGPCPTVTGTTVVVTDEAAVAGGAPHGRPR